MFNNSSCKLLVGIVILMVANTTFAQDQETITIEAQQAKVLGKNVFVYSGDVVIKHSEVSIKADKVRLKKNDKTNWFEATGNPAHASWLDDKGTNYGSAENIKMTNGTKRELEMNGNVNLTYRDQQIIAHHIHYDFDTEQLNITSDNNLQNKIKIILKQ